MTPCTGPRGLGHVFTHLGLRPQSWHRLAEIPAVIQALHPRAPREVFGVARLRDRLCETLLWPYFTAEEFLVAPPTWLEGVSWPIADPPSPYETACAMAVLGAVGRGVPPDRCSRTALRLWLLGVPDYVVEEIMSPLPLVTHINTAIQDLLRSPVFFLWALGTDLTPMMHDGKRWAAGRAIMDGKPFPFEGKARHDILLWMRNHPWVQAQLYSQQRLNPIQRALHRTTYIFPDTRLKFERYPLLRRTPP